MDDRFTAELWEWDARGGWFFLTLPEELADDIHRTPSRSAASAGRRISTGGIVARHSRDQYGVG